VRLVNDEKFGADRIRADSDARHPDGHAKFSRVGKQRFAKVAGVRDVERAEDFVLAEVDDLFAKPNIEVRGCERNVGLARKELPTVRVDVRGVVDIGLR
jgi:hypothetical protein